MPETPPAHPDQKAYWNGPAGKNWVAAHDLLDQMFLPIEQLLAERITTSTRSVLDIGCGAGGLTLAAARRIGSGGRVLGVDVATPMIEAAKARAEHVRGEAAEVAFLEADAANYPFEAGGFDAIVSRFGVMFFENPVAAFANLRRAAAPGAPIDFAAWRGPEHNAFMTTAERAAAPLLPELPPRVANAPGQFAFADEARVRAILADNGWSDIVVRPLDAECAFPATELTRFITRLGPVSRAVAELDETAREKVLGTVRAAFGPYVQGNEVRFTAACWAVSARA